MNAREVETNFKNAKKPRQRTISAMKNEATSLHSQLVRSRGVCENCGNAWRTTGSKLECAHIVSRRFAATRTDETNAFCLCTRCHMHFTEWPLEFRDFVVAKVGQAHYDALKAKAQAGAPRPVRAFWESEVARLRALTKEKAA